MSDRMARSDIHFLEEPADHIAAFPSELPKQNEK
jgi:hypothetical protein